MITVVTGLRQLLGEMGSGLHVDLALLLFAFALIAPCLAWSQDASVFAPGVKVLATLETSVYDWSPDGQRLAFATDDGIWTAKAPVGEKGQA